MNEIGEGAFAFCSNLTDINISNDNPNYTVYDGAIYNKSLTELIFFPGGLSSVSFPTSINKIGNFAFTGSNEKLTSITIPNSVTEIGKNAFGFCSGLNYVTIPNSVSEIRENAFYNCTSLKHIDLPNSITSIREALFCGTGLTSITIPNSVVTIESYAFRGCSDLKTIYIPSSVQEFGYMSFYQCYNIEQFYYAAEPLYNNPSFFFSEEIYEKATLYVKESMVESAKANRPWSKFNHIEAHDFTSIDDVAEVVCSEPTEVYNLNGVRIASSTDGLPAGIYIVRQGTHTRKVTVR